MVAIFSNFLERSVEIFKDDFSVFGESLKKCMGSLEEVSKRCEETRLMLNWEKCYGVCCVSEDFYSYSEFTN